MCYNAVTIKLIHFKHYEQSMLLDQTHRNGLRDHT
jgi:hypothetical protein